MLIPSHLAGLPWSPLTLFAGQQPRILKVADFGEKSSMHEQPLHSKSKLFIFNAKHTVSGELMWSFLVRTGVYFKSIPKFSKVWTFCHATWWIFPTTRGWVATFSTYILLGWILTRGLIFAVDFGDTKWKCPATAYCPVTAWAIPSVLWAAPWGAAPYNQLSLAQQIFPI